MLSLPRPAAPRLVPFVLPKGPPPHNNKCDAAAKAFFPPVRQMLSLRYPDLLARLAQHIALLENNPSNSTWLLLAPFAVATPSLKPVASSLSTANGVADSSARIARLRL